MQVTYIKHSGSDLDVVNAARVSFKKKSTWKLYDGENSNEFRLKDKDSKLVYYLARNKHFSPFNHCFASFHVKAPIYVARQLQKHEYMPWNEASRRYVDEDPEFYEPQYWRKKAEDKKQGSGGNMELSLFRKNCIRNISSGATTTYRELIKDGVAPEMARSILPQNMMTEWLWSATLGAFAKMCNLRCTSDTQEETRMVADSISTILGGLYPTSWNALMSPEVKARHALAELKKREKKQEELNKFWS
jgi:thymidylate synthase (FAD)